MARIIIHRAMPFRRGDQSIGIYVDGKASGSLLSNNQLSLEVGPGRHDIRAFSNGLRGKKFSVDVAEGTEMYLQVRSPAMKDYWWPNILLLFVIAIPDKWFGPPGFLIQTLLWLGCLLVLIFVRLPHMRDMLRIEPADTAVENAAAIGAG